MKLQKLGKNQENSAKNAHFNSTRLQYFLLSFRKRELKLNDVLLMRLKDLKEREIHSKWV